MLLVVWIGHGFEELGVAPDATDILRRAGSFAFDAKRVPNSLLCLEAALKQDLVLPVVTEVVLVAEAVVFATFGTIWLI